MYEYIRALILGYEEGIKDNKKVKIKLSKTDIVSKLYNIGYLEAQNNKKTSSNNKKYIV